MMAIRKFLKKFILIGIILIIIVSLILFFEYNNKPEEVQKMINVSKQLMGNNDFSEYFGEIYRVRYRGYALRGVRGGNLNGKTNICFLVKGDKNKADVEFIFIKPDSLWVFEEYKIGICSLK